MKKYLLLLVVTGLYGATADRGYAQEAATVRNDSITNVVKLKSLQSQRDYLMRQIDVENKKRNAQINGITPERQEELNNRQDSICLSLRSQLVDIILEIKERAPSVATPQLIQQYNNLVNRKKEE